MSGAEAALVIGFISSTITILETLAKAYQESKDAWSLPACFRDVAQRLPLVSETLQIALARVRADAPDEEFCAALKTVVEGCNTKVQRLETIFRKVTPFETSSRFERYVAVVKLYGKGNLVEDLMKGILQDVQIIAGNHGAKAATEAQVADLAKAIHDLSAMPPSVPEMVLDDPNASFIHRGSGQQNVHTGTGDMNINSGSGRIYVARTQYFGSE
ncbi:hypothetical protein DL764_005295 [Monosporascus ibericus]|uniref:NACHT-NTPase and P-loop NTPases N-terminal domain-containing protein n=1 Tax=Monosporascus ibericus TaxID=155417 RepID=A0A4Q4TCB3_9PEZI|nr:hypothetical protein DL764_005295 [Monosporascus ibericus]